MNRNPSSSAQAKSDPHGITSPRDHDEHYYNHGEDYDARGGQFFGPPGDYGRRQGWLDGHLVGRERAMGAPATGYDDARHGQRRAGVYGGTGPFAWPGKPQSGRTGGEGGDDDTFDPDYHQWRHSQMQQFDKDYQAFRGERYKKFSDEFTAWRTARTQTAGQPVGVGKPDDTSGETSDDGAARRSK